MQKLFIFDKQFFIFYEIFNNFHKNGCIKDYIGYKINIDINNDIINNLSFHYNKFISFICSII